MVCSQAGVWHHKVMDINEVALAPQPNGVGAFTGLHTKLSDQADSTPSQILSVEAHLVAAASQLGMDTAAVLLELDLSPAQVAVLLAGREATKG